MLYAPNSAHNVWIQSGAELGIPGALMYTVILITGFSAAFRARWLAVRLPDPGLLPGMAAASIAIVTHIFIQGFTTGMAHREIVHFSIVMAYAIHQTAREKYDAAMAAAAVASPQHRCQTRSGPVRPNAAGSRAVFCGAGAQRGGFLMRLVLPLFFVGALFAQTTRPVVPDHPRLLLNDTVADTWEPSKSRLTAVMQRAHPQQRRVRRFHRHQEHGLRPQPGLRSVFRRRRLEHGAGLRPELRHSAQSR